jgi:predicted enzyme related to lactoylglutathione lyase
MVVNEIGVVSIPVSDQNRAKRFYTERLGFSIIVERSNIMGSGQNWMMLRPCGGGAAVTLVNWFDTMPAESLRGLVISTDDVDGEYQRLKAGGVDIDEIKRAARGRYASFRDSEGNGLVIQQNA